MKLAKMSFRKYLPQRKHPYHNSRSKSLRLQCKRELEAEMELFYNEWLVVESDERCSQDVTSVDSIPTRKKDSEYLCKEKQKFSGCQTNGIILDSASLIKTEVLDSCDENHELNLPNYSLCEPAIYPWHAVKTEILDASETNQKPPLSSNKKKYTRTNHVYESSRIKSFHSECFKNRNTEKSVTFNNKLSKCSVLLHDCLSPKNLASILASFKSLKINKSVLDAKFESSSIKNSPYVSEGDKRIAFSSTYKKESYNEAKKKMPFSKKNQKLTANHKIFLNNIKKKEGRSGKSKYICNCSKTRINESQLLGNNFESAQQLCSCLKGINKLSEDLTPIEILMEETLFFYPDFGKITCGINKIS